MAEPHDSIIRPWVLGVAESRRTLPGRRISQPICDMSLQQSVLRHAN
jgi:hypothetical protein